MHPRHEGSTTLGLSSVFLKTDKYKDLRVDYYIIENGGTLFGVLLKKFEKDNNSYKLVEPETECQEHFNIYYRLIFLKNHIDNRVTTSHNEDEVTLFV